MSRNLNETTCYFCHHELVMTGEPRLFDYTKSVYYEEYRAMTVRDAECPVCLAQYLAWVHPGKGNRPTQSSDFATHYDLSFRHSFNDEPSDRDLPRYAVETRTVYVRTGPFVPDSGCYLRLGEYKEPEEKP